MNDRLGGISGSRPPGQAAPRLVASRGDPGRKEKRRRLEEQYGLEDRDLPGGIFDDREDH